MWGCRSARAITEEGFPVIGLDIDDEKVEKLNAGQSYIRHIPSANIQAMLKTGRFRASSDFGQIANADIIISLRADASQPHTGSRISPMSRRPPT